MWSGLKFHQSLLPLSLIKERGCLFDAIRVGLHNKPSIVDSLPRVNVVMIDSQL